MTAVGDESLGLLASFLVGVDTRPLVARQSGAPSSPLEEDEEEDEGEAVSSRDGHSPASITCRFLPACANRSMVVVSRVVFFQKMNFMRLSSCIQVCGQGPRTVSLAPRRRAEKVWRRQGESTSAFHWMAWTKFAWHRLPFSGSVVMFLGSTEKVGIQRRNSK